MSERLGKKKKRKRKSPPAPCGEEPVVLKPWLIHVETVAAGEGKMVNQSISTTALCLTLTIWILRRYHGKLSWQLECNCHGIWFHGSQKKNLYDFGDPLFLYPLFTSDASGQICQHILDGLPWNCALICDFRKMYQDICAMYWIK